MIGRSLTRRLEHLETEFLPVAGETKIIRVDFCRAGRKGFRSQRLHNKPVGPESPANPPLAAEIANDIPS
jgi:hypothetical protein